MTRFELCAAISPVAKPEMCESIYFISRNIFFTNANNLTRNIKIVGNDASVYAKIFTIMNNYACRVLETLQVFFPEFKHCII